MDFDRNLHVDDSWESLTLDPTFNGLKRLTTDRLSPRWAPRDLAQHFKVPVSVVARAESSLAEPTVTIAQLNTFMQALRAAGAIFRHRNDHEMAK